ncbi:Crp/Fnr family transcriptional regulator [Rhodoplanes sp. Z2-YC6860]|uniref:Crp/Fnr family transcriptional regulator n=1 Tax=Rhodoplanes sp. Z2-YC6860 TaxID=674703 RepID=UPI00078EB315|nr:Crp/Fnr family transcriptional regulator [Rhodoplanes sp. Z2-YC6860]AMN40437.1 cAMP-binding protein [Rhodoplanes sp. Z2-YC6860]
MPEQNLALLALPSDVVQRLRSSARPRHFSPGQVLFATGDKLSGLYFPESGAVSLVCELETGQLIETAFIGNESVVGGAAALDDTVAQCKAIVQIGGDGFSVDANSARQIARESEEFRTTIFRHERFILAQAQQSAACYASHCLDQRLARWLLRGRDASGTDTFTLTQELLAEMLGVRRTSVSTAANSLLKAGVIHYRRGHIKIDRPDALQQIACECYGAIRMRYDALCLGQVRPDHSSTP